MAVQKINIAQEAAKLLQPFEMAHLGDVDGFAVSVFICQGAIGWHCHVDEDELFLVQSGVITLETDWGNTRLYPDEMAVAPKGVGHRSSSFLWSVVLLFRAQVMTHRKNGDRRIGPPSEGRAIHKVSVAQAARGLEQPFRPVALAMVDDGALSLALVRGETPWIQHEQYGGQFLVFEGEMTLSTGAQDLRLQAGEMTFLPRGSRYRLAAAERATVLVFRNRVVTGM